MIDWNVILNDMYLLFNSISMTFNYFEKFNFLTKSFKLRQLDVFWTRELHWISAYLFFSGLLVYFIMMGSIY